MHCCCCWEITQLAFRFSSHCKTCTTGHMFRIWRKPTAKLTPLGFLSLPEITKKPQMYARALRIECFFNCSLRHPQQEKPFAWNMQKQKVADWFHCREKKVPVYKLRYSYTFHFDRTSTQLQHPGVVMALMEVVVIICIQNMSIIVPPPPPLLNHFKTMLPCSLTSDFLSSVISLNKLNRH